MKLRTCPICGRRFTPLRASQTYCSPQHRKTAENRRLRGSPLPDLADDPKTEKKDEQNQQSATAMREDQPPSYVVRAANWIAVNEITYKLDYDGRPIGWVIYVERQKAWFARMRNERGDFSGGWTTLARAKAMVESWIKEEPFTKTERERSWRGDLMGVI